MNRIDFLSIMGEFDFAEAAEILLERGYITFKLARLSSERGFVYLWVEIAGEVFTVVYVGKAGETLQARCNQHADGFKNSSSGRAHADRIRHGISENKRYVVYAKKSETKDIFGERDISMACVEELAFIQKSSPYWNSA